MSDAYPQLFSSFDLHGVKLRNRIVHCSMTTKMGVDQQVSDELLNYHHNRAVGGAGMIVTEPLAIQPWHNESYKVSVFGDKAAEGLARWANIVESQGCRLLGQLQDSGRGRHEAGKHPYAIGPSALPDDLSWVVPKAMEPSEIERLIGRFAQAARLLQKAGFSGVELSAGHGHLFHQFLSPWSNLRTDEWGGSVENRTRLVRLLAEQIRDLCGPSFVIGVRLPADDGLENSIGITEATAITKALSLPNILSYFCHVQGSHSQRLDMHLPDMHGSRLPYLDLSRQLRQSAGAVPMMAVGLITDPAEAERIVESGDSELVGLGRPLVTDAAWPNKAKQGRASDIRYCVSCNTCWAAIIRDGGTIACDNNPRVGFLKEADWWPQPANHKKKIVVVGGGVSGLEAAWVAAARGHDVTLLGNSEQLGGKTFLQAQLPGGENLSSVYDYQLQAAQRAGLKIEIRGKVTSEQVINMDPSDVILATGSQMLWPRQLSADLCDEGFVPDLRDLMQQMLARSLSQEGVAREQGTALIFDQDHSLGTYMAAELLCKIFERVVLVTPRETFAQQESLITKQGIFKRLNELNIQLMPFTELGDMSRLEDGVAMVSNIYTKLQTPINDLALLTYATPRKPNGQLLKPLQTEGIDVHLVGDCLIQSTLREATATGHALGNSL